MIFKRRISAALLVLFVGSFVTSEPSDDFKFDSDDLQIVYSDPSETIMQPPSRYLYSKEISQCPTGESKMMLTLLLQSLRWSDVSEKKKEKAIKKLSRFFLVPRQFITVSDIHTPEIIEMLKHSINKSNNLLNAKETVGRVEFMIGCGDKIFENGKKIAHQVNEHVKMGALDELSGLPFNWWNIWSKHVKSRVQRMKRQTDGSGNDPEDEIDYEEDYEDENPEDDEENTEDELASPNEFQTEAPRVRHNQRKNKSKKKSKNIFVKQVHDEPAMEVADKTESPIHYVEISRAPAVESPLVEFDPEPMVTQRVIESPTPIDESENKKLESYVNKTIVNDNNVVDVPVFEEKDKLLEEVKKMISEPQPEPTTVMVSSPETTTYQAPMETTTEHPLTITPQTNEPSTPSTGPTTFATPAPETETIFVPIRINHNENINNYEDKQPEVTTVENTSTTQSLEDEITERMSTQVHELTQASITSTLPTTTEILTTTEPSTPTTISIIDATLAVDQVSTLNALEEERGEKVRPRSEKKPAEESESNYDDEYDDVVEEENNNVDVDSPSSTPSTTQRPSSTQRTTTQPPTTTEVVTDPPSTISQEELTTAQTIPQQTSTEVGKQDLSASPEPSNENYDDFDNDPPRVNKRIPKAVAIAGKPFSIVVEKDVFYDEQDKEDLELSFLDKHEQPMPSSSWIRYDKEKREIYGLPLERDVSKYAFKLRAADKSGDYVDENIEITVQQHKGYRSVNHEIYILVKLEKTFESSIDWEIRLLRGIVEAVEDKSMGNVVVREVRQHKYESNMFTFVFTNDTLPKDKCPKEELDKLMQKMTKQALNAAMTREITVRNVEKELIGSCLAPPKPVIPTNTMNYPPTVLNAVDRVKAFTGQLLVFEVPKDTFHDPEDQTDLKLSLLDEERLKLSPNHWLQFDSKNREFYGVPTLQDKSEQNYVLVAEDRSGLTTNDALVVEVDHSNFKRDLSAVFEYQLDIAVDQFQNAATKRKFIECVAKVFGDATTDNIVIKMVKKLQYAGTTSVLVQNTTLSLANHRECPNGEIDRLRNTLLRQDRSVKDEIKEEFKADFPVLKITVSPTGKCTAGDSYHHNEPDQPQRPEDLENPILNQDVLITYVLPTAIILLMLLIALLIACLLYKRRNTGKMELGDEEERKSFRSKGIPVIFQDELEEKPEIVTKSPVIMKDEKPPLLPQYNGMSQDGDEDTMDQYIPPQPVMMGSRESRGKSPVTPSYRRPPPYVSP